MEYYKNKYYIIAYVLMTNHIHIVIGTTDKDVSDLIKRVHGRYAWNFNKKYKYIGHLFQDRLILTNPGNFIGGISSDNILHHPPIARNSHLADLLDRLKLVNRSNLGVPRIYKSLLIEGKEPPQYREIGECVELTLIASTIVPTFRSFVRNLNDKGIIIDVDHLIILNYLLRHREIDTYNASMICQRSIDQVRETLSYMENNLKLIQSGGNNSC